MKKQKEIYGQRLFKGLLLAVSVAVLAGCANITSRQMADDEEEVVTGPSSRRNYTVMDPAFACLANGMRANNRPVIGVAVGDVKDYTGKYGQNEGNTITQGGALMVYSALGKLGDVVQVQERFDTRIAELELAYTDRRQLGDGRTHSVEAGKPAVPWVPYFGGSILRSSYYIVGGITELNYNIASGGFEAGISGVGVKNRTYTMNIAVDLRIVDTRSLVVVKTISLQKQIIGQEVGLGVYRFFGDDLVDINVGSKRQEPLQLGVRATIEHGVIELLSAVSGLDAKPCVSRAVEKFKAGNSLDKNGVTPTTAPAVNALEPTTPKRAEVVPAGSQSGLAPQNAVAVAGGGVQQLPFDFNSSAISPQAMTLVEKVVEDANKGGAPVTFQIIARDNEPAQPAQRMSLTNQRIKAVTDVLVRGGISASRIGVSWLPEPTDSSITRQGAGFQLIATMVIAR